MWITFVDIVDNVDNVDNLKNTMRLHHVVSNTTYNSQSDYICICSVFDVLAVLLQVEQRGHPARRANACSVLRF